MADSYSVNLGRTINLGNYETFRADVTYKSAVRDSEDHDDAFKRVHKEAERRLDEICDPIEEALKGNVDGRKKK